MTDAEDLLLAIANSMERDFIDPAAHANWCVEEAKRYFAQKHAARDERPPTEGTS